MKPLTLFLCLITLSALACSTAGIAESLISSGGVLFQDFFTDSQSGWGELDNDTGTAGYLNGAYRLVVNQEHVNLWTHPGMEFSNIRQEVSMMTVAGPQDNRMGLICRMVDDDNFYFFVISADGYYGIGKIKDGQASLLTGENMQPHGAIQKGNQINRMRADCIGSVLVLYINDIMITSVQDADFKSGDVGILAGSFSQPGIEVYFDNFSVFKP